MSVASVSEPHHDCRVTPGTPPLPPFPKYTKIWVVGESCELLQFPLSATGNVAPTVNIQGTNNFEGPEGNDFSLTYEADVDSGGNKYVLGNYETNGTPNIVWFVMVFSPGQTGNAVPVRNITGSNTVFGTYLGSGVWAGLCVDSNDNIYVGVGNKILKFIAGSNGNATPSLLVQSSSFGDDNTSNQAIMSLTFDAVRQWIWVPFGGGRNGGPGLAPGVAAYDLSGNRQALINYASFVLPWQVAIGPDGSVYVSDLFSNNGAPNVFIFSSGDFTTPTRTLYDSAGLWSGNVAALGLAVDSSGIIYISVAIATGSIDNTIYSYPANSNGDVFGTNLTAINGALTDLSHLLDNSPTQPLKLRGSVL